MLFSLIFKQHPEMVKRLGKVPSELREIVLIEIYHIPIFVDVCMLWAFDTVAEGDSILSLYV